ncbi:hypothetical protein NM688_g4626 [Phlebia brevispora]|uniref:Uncharacterized protein n=1 Tax=Phlebia brevispora TaxID=194682 RepID=A0ACC1T2C0_9APHY|nr:hypothetical protein NM688_g4626 [Phlebia brevispora]
MTQDAVKLKDKGNELFKAMKFAEAAAFYTKAEHADTKNAVYPSNLSAALYEIGDYHASAEAILRSWKLLDASPDANQSMITRLSTRLAKCLSHGLLGKQVSDAFLGECDAAIEHFKKSSIDLASAPFKAELENAWKLWDNVRRGDEASREEAAMEAMREFLNLSQRRQTQQPYLEYFKVGTDEVFSLLDGWSPRESYPLDLRALPESRLAKIALLFGGVGDARHVFATLIGLRDTYTKLSKPKKKALHVHMTMLDHHPAILARDLCILMLLVQLTDDSISAETRLEMETTAAYTYSAQVMPPYSAARLNKVIEDLVFRLSESPPDLPGWLHVTTDSVEPIIKVLSMWLDTRMDPKSKNTAYILEKESRFSPNIVEETEKLTDMLIGDQDTERVRLRKAQQDKLAAIEQFVNNLDAETLGKMGMAPRNASPQDVKRLLEENRQRFINEIAAAEGLRAPEGPPPMEDMWYKKMNVYLPPRKFWARHPGFPELMDQLENEGKMHAVRLKQAQAHLRGKWKPNATIFYNEYFDKNHPGAFDDVGWSPMPFAKTAEHFLDTHRSDTRKESTTPEPERTMVESVSKFFRVVADALKTLEGHVKLEVLQGSLNDEMSKMRLKDGSSRPSDFPKSFVRMWLSNVPDYTNGLLGTAVHVLPSLDASPEAACGWNSFSGTASWKNADHYNYAHVSSHHEVPRNLGLKVIHSQIVMQSLSIKTEPLPRPLSALASRQELTAWLTRVLFQILMPGKTAPPPTRITLPNNVNAFIHLLIHLHSVGFPAHWLAGFLQNMLSGSMVSDIQSYQDFYPIPLEERHRRVPSRKVRLDPWLLDLENALAIVYDALPFAVTVPSDLAHSPSDIALWKAKLISDPLMNFTSQSVAHLHTPVDPVMNLLVFKGDNTGQIVLDSYKKIFEGGKTVKPGDFFFLTAIDVYDMEDTGEVRWRMSRERVKKMKREVDWYILPVRSDNYLPVAGDVPVRTWIEVSD